MSERELIERLARLVDAGGLPQEVPVLSLEPVSTDVIDRRLRELLGTIGGLTGLVPRLNVFREPDRTLLRLPLGGQIAGYHASGAIEFKSAMGPMDNLIGRERPVDELTELVMATAGRLQVERLVPSNEELGFERLWQIKASGMNPEGIVAEPVVCRAIGAFRHRVADLPVWGAASVAVQVAAGGELDALRVNVRATTDRMIDRVPVLPPEEGARRVVEQLETLIPERRGAFSEIATAKAFRFGYVSLPKRQQQAVLPPVYVAEVDTGGEDPMSYLAIVSASEREFLPLRRVGADPAVLERRERQPLPV